MLLCAFLAVYSTLCSPQPSDAVFALNVDLMLNRKPSESVKIGSGHDTFVSTSTAAITISCGHRSRTGYVVSVGY